MLMAFVGMNQFGNSFQYFECRAEPHTWYKGIYREPLNKNTAGISVKIRSVFWGDPRCGKKIEKNTSEIDRRTRFAPLEAQMIGAYIS